MAISITLDRKDLSFPVEQRYKYQLDLLFKRADKKSNGFVTIELSLPKRIGTDSQNKAFHALLNEYYISGQGSYSNYEDMRDSFKVRAAGASGYIYLQSGKQHTCNLLENIPKNAQYVEIPKSWTDFTRAEREMAIKLLIAEGYEAGMNSKHWDEIIEGMEVN